jgi:DNA topoisomerase-1
MIPLPPGIKRTPGGQPIPPKWTQVMIATSAKSPHQAVGRDEAGRIVYIRSSAYTQKSKDKKYNRLTSFMEALPRIVEKVQTDAKKGKEEAKVLDLIYKTGFRVDSGGNTKAKVQAYGASGLLGKHVLIDNDTLKFNFPSKKGGTTKIDLQDPEFVKLLKGKKPDEKLFNTDYRNVTKYWKKLTGKYLIKDLRLFMGTSTAIKEIKKLPMPTTVKEYKSNIKTVSVAVANKLQNTPTVAKGSYIMPEVFDDWNKALEEIRAKKVLKKGKKNPKKILQMKILTSEDKIYFESKKRLSEQLRAQGEKRDVIESLKDGESPSEMSNMLGIPLDRINTIISELKEENPLPEKKSFSILPILLLGLGIFLFAKHANIGQVRPVNYSEDYKES